MTSLIDATYALSLSVPIGHELLNGLASEIFSIKVANTQTDTLTDNNGRLKLAAHEQIDGFKFCAQTKI